MWVYCVPWGNNPSTVWVVQRMVEFLSRDPSFVAILHIRYVWKVLGCIPSLLGTFLPHEIHPSSTRLFNLVCKLLFLFNKFLPLCFSLLLQQLRTSAVWKKSIKTHYGIFDVYVISFSQFPHHHCASSSSMNVCNCHHKSKTRNRTRKKARDLPWKEGKKILDRGVRGSHE